MFSQLDENEIVIIDFDSCVSEGSPLPLKRGTVRDGVCTAVSENDDLGMDLIRQFVDHPDSS